MVVAGWQIHQPALTNPIPGDAALSMSTGIGFVACGAALFFAAAKKTDVVTIVGTCLFSLVALVVGACVALNYMGINTFDLDSYLMGVDLGLAAHAAPGRMAPQTAIGLIASAVALMLSQHRNKSVRYTSQLLALSVFGLGLAVVCGYTYGSSLMYRIGSMTPVALVNGITFLISGLGMFFARPRSGFAGVVTDTGVGGRTARLLLPVALLAPIALGYLRLFGQRFDWYEASTDTSLIVCLMTACFSLIVLWHCLFLARLSRREKAAVDALQKNEERTRLIIDKAYDAFVAIDSAGNVLDWNCQAERIFGWDRSEILGKSLCEHVVPLEFRKSHDDGMRAYTSGTGEGKILNKRVQLIAQRKSGDQFPVELAVFPVEVDGQATFCAFVQDITDRKRIETQVELLNEQLVQARDQALEGSRLKSEFLANMSHEIRTPMNAVIGLSDLLRRTSLNRDQQRFVDLIVNSGQSLLQIIDDILIFSKIEAGRLDMDTIDFDLVNCVENAADLLADKAREKNVSLTTFLEPEIPHLVRGDQQRLKQVLLNLMSNAIKFTERGRILVRASLVAETEETTTVSFSVSDTGIGITEDGQKVLFTPFTQVDGSTTRRHGGTGLGLTISKRLVELMGGDIGVVSAEGQGSTFTFSIPFKRGNVKAQRLDRIASLESVRMLLVGLPDHEANVVESYVESWGLRPSFTSFAQEASLQVAHAIKESDPYLVVLLDSQIQDADPFEFVKELRETTSINNTKMLLLLSIDDIGQTESALQAGFDGTITRPIKQSSLFNSLLALFEPRALAQIDTMELNSSQEPPSTKFVLVAEDNIVNQEVAVLLLEELGYNAHVVANGKLAVDAAQDPNCQLILMDCQMPEMDGFEATRLIRQRETATDQHIPIIAMTAHAMEGDRELCLQAGMDDYVSKPVTINRLRDVVQRWFNYKSTYKQTTYTSLPAMNKKQAEQIAKQGIIDKKSAMSQAAREIVETPTERNAKSTHFEGEQIDMRPTEDEVFESERRMLGLGRTRGRKWLDELSGQSEEMLDDALSTASGDDNDDEIICRRPSKSINMSPAEAMSEVDNIMGSRKEPESMAPIGSGRRRMLSNTVNDIEISNLFDYDALESTFGPQSARKFLNLFASMTPSLLSRLETAITGHKHDAAKAAAHELKGMCATIHIPAMVDLCRGIEESTETADWSNAETLLCDLKRTFSAAEASIKKL